MQRLAAEAALPVYHDSTGFARVALIYKKKRPEPKFGSLFGAEDGTFPRANQQSTGLLVPAHLRPKSRRYAAVGLRNAPAGAVRCVALFKSSHGQHKQKVPSRGTAGDLLLMGHEGLEPPTKRL